MVEHVLSMCKSLSLPVMVAHTYSPSTHVRGGKEDQKSPGCPQLHAQVQSQLGYEKVLKRREEGWRDGSVSKSTDCSSRGPEFNSQQPHGGSQPSVMGSDALFWCV